MKSILSNELIHEIAFSEIENVSLGHAEDLENGTGCSVLVFDKMSATGVDVRGGGPASRETTILDPTVMTPGVNAVFLSGGSAFGLDCASGIMEYLEKRNIGFDVSVTVVPLVVGSCIFDLMVKNHKVRPDKVMGYKACEDSVNKRSDSGNIGAGTGASVGKINGRDTCMKSGLGTFAIQIGQLKLGAVVVVNALGDIFDVDSGEKLAGLLNPEGNGFEDSLEVYLKKIGSMGNVFTMNNTTIGAIVTNADFDKNQMKKIAAMAHNGYARTIRPVHTTADGDSIYATSVGDVKAELDVVGSLAAEVMARAINRAVTSAEGMYGLKAYKDLK